MRDADMILWVGISFQQSASTAYFRRVRGYLQASFTCTAYFVRPKNTLEGVFAVLRLHLSHGYEEQDRIELASQSNRKMSS